MNATPVETLYLEGTDGTLYQIVIVVSGYYTKYVERKGLKYEGGSFEKLPKLRLFSYNRDEKYEQIKPSSPQKWLDILQIANAKWADEKKWDKIFESIPALPAPPGTTLPKTLGKMTLREVCREVLTNTDKYARNMALEAIFRAWSKEATPAIEFLQRVHRSAVTFSILMYGLKWNVAGLDSFARAVLFSGEAKFPWLKSLAALQFYAAAYLERVAQQKHEQFPPRVQFLLDLVQFLYKAVESPDKANEFATASPQRARDVAKVLYTQQRYAALRVWCVGALQAGVADGLLWKLLGNACKNTKVPGQTHGITTQLILECEKNAKYLGYSKAEVDALEVISRQVRKGAEWEDLDEEFYIDFDQDEEFADEDEEEDSDEENDDEDEDGDTDEENDDEDEDEDTDGESDDEDEDGDSDEESDDEDEDGDSDEENDDEDEDGDSDEENDDEDTGEESEEKEIKDNSQETEKAQALEVGKERRRGEPGKSATELFPMLSGTDLLVEFFAGESFKSRGYRSGYALPNQELLPWVIQQLSDPRKMEFLQKYLVRLVAILEEGDIRKTSLGGAFRVALKLAELLKVPEVLGLYAILLDKYFVQMGSTGYLARRVVRTWKAWGKADPDTYVRALTPFLAFYPPLEPMFIKDQAKFVRTPFEPVPIKPPPPELIPNVNDLLNKIKPDAEEEEKIELLRQVLNFGDTKEGLLLMAQAMPRSDSGKYLEKALSLDLDNFQLWLDVAEIARGRDKLKYLFGAAERNPNNPAAYFALGKALKDRGMTNKGITYIKKAIELAPTNTDYLTGLAKFLKEDDQFTEAAEVIKHVLLRNLEDYNAWMSLAECMSQVGASAEALYCVERLQQIKKELPGEVAKLPINEWKKQKIQPRDPLQGMPRDATLKVGTPDLPGKYILLRMLLGNSKRLVHRYKQIRAGYSSILGEDAWRTREEIFPEIWDNAPEAVWEILQRAQNIIIRDFGLRVLSQSPKGQALLEQLDLGQLLTAVKTPHPHTQDLLLPLIQKRLLALPEVTTETFESLLNLEVPRAWDLTVDILVGKKIQWTPTILAQVLAKPSERVKEFCINNLQQLYMMQEDIMRIFIQLVAKGNVPWEVARLLPIELKFIIPVGGLVPLFHSEHRVSQQLLLDLLSKGDPTLRPLSAEELVVGLQHPEKEVRQQILRFLRAQLDHPSPQLTEYLTGLVSIIWIPYDDVIAMFPLLLDNFMAQNPTHIHLLLEHLVDQGAKRALDLAQEKIFFEVVSRIPLEAWKGIDSKWIEDVVAGAGEDVRALGGLIAAQSANRAISPAIVPLIAKSEQGMLRRLLVENLTKFPDLMTNQPDILLTVIESDFDDLFSWGCQVIKQRGLPKETTAPLADIFRNLLDSPVFRVRNFSFSFLSEKFEGNLPIDVVLRLLEHPAIDIRQRLAGALGRYLERIVQQDPQLAFRYAKSIILVPNKITDAKDHVYQFLIDFANTAPKYRASIKELLLKIGAGSIIKDRERALSAYVRIQE